MSKAATIKADMDALVAKLATLAVDVDLGDARVAEVIGTLRQQLLEEVLPKIPTAASTEEQLSVDSSLTLLRSVQQSTTSVLRSASVRCEIFKLFAASAGHPPFRGGLRAEFVSQTLDGELFREFFGAPSMDAVKALADLLNHVVPFDNFTMESSTKTSKDADLNDNLLRSGADEEDSDEEEDDDEDGEEDGDGEVNEDEDEDEDEENGENGTYGANLMDTTSSTEAASASDDVPTPGSAAKQGRRGRPRTLSLYDAMLLVLFILKTGATHRGCGPWFNVRKTTAQRYWVYTIQWMAAGFRTLDAKFAASQAPPEDPDPEDVMADFNFAVIIDGTEIWCQVPGDRMVQRAIYSEYKSHTT